MQNSVISRLFRPQILEMSAYKVADAKGFIKLDAMENPYNLPDDVASKWLEALQDCELNRYPDPAARELNAIIREVNKIPEEFEILLGNGSDEIIQLLLMALPSGSCVLAPEPGFVMYRQICLSLGLDYHGVALNADFSLNLDAMLATIEKHQPAVIFLAYPNNPTGNLFAADDIRQIIKSSEGLVIIDEAYAPFANASFLGELGQHENLLVMRTLSKLGLAGLRLGFIAGKPEIIGELDKIRLPYNINVLTQETAHFALKHYQVFESQTREICSQRGVMLDALNAMPGIKAYESAANFILFQTENIEADIVFQGLKDRGVLIKNLSPQGELLSDCLRVTIGTAEENQAFLKALEQILQ